MTLASETNNDTFVSVLLPVFNGGTSLEGAVRSILNQTHRRLELLVIDDGSTDDAIHNLRQTPDPRVRFLGDKQRRGLSARLNEGIDAARGEIIARMDADDLAFPERLERQLQYLQTHPEVDLVGCRVVVFRGHDIIGLHPFAAHHEQICAQPWRGFPLPHPTWMGRTAWFRRFFYAIPEISRAEDQELLLRSYRYSRFACLDEILLAYRQGDFHFGKTIVARRSLLAAQLSFFWHHKEWVFAALALGVGCLKVIIDSLASLPGCRRLFFTRMAEPVPDAARKLVLKELSKI